MGTEAVSLQRRRERCSSSRFPGLLAALIIVLLAGVFVPSASPTPTHVVLLLIGTNDQDGNHGAFTAPPPICPSGTWLGNAAGHRTFTCTDGSGTFGASFQGEGNGGQSILPWQIDSGTGKYAKLRGVGTGTIVITVPGDRPQFKDTWDGNVDFDASAPVLTSFKASAKPIRGGHRRYLVRVIFHAEDNVKTNPVAYDATLLAGYTQLAEKKGTATSAVTLTFRVRAPRNGRYRLFFDLHDPVGNDRLVLRKVSVPRR